MKTRRQRCAAMLASSVLALSLFAPDAQAEPAAPEPTAKEQAARWGTVAFDLVMLRPFQIASAAAGVVFYVPAAIIGAGGGEPAVDDAWNTFVGYHADDAFKRPLGSL